MNQIINNMVATTGHAYWSDAVNVLAGNEHVSVVELNTLYEQGKTGDHPCMDGMFY